MHSPHGVVLVTGATGYIGGRLAPNLLEQGYHVRCMARHATHLKGRQWPGAQIVEGDALHPETLSAALDGVDTAYYLIHSMSAGDDRYAHTDRKAARNFARAAQTAGVRRVIYLGGLGRDTDLAPHLRCRQEVGDILREEGPTVVEFRAAVIVGSGSASFELIRHIVEQHPVIPLFPWLRTRCQPIAVRDVLKYLSLGIDVPADASRTYEIGGPEILTYEEMLRVYARRRRLRRWFVPVPYVSARMCAWWIELMTPIPAGYARPLIEAAKDEVVCRDESARKAFRLHPIDYETAVRYALLRIKEGAVRTTWTMAMFPRQSPFSQMSIREGLICEESRVVVDATPAALFHIYSGLGGERGWLFANWLWKLRAALDRLVGGVGMRRGRRNRDEIGQGEPLDFWRVEKITADRLLLLRAEMAVPGKAWLQFESSPAGSGRSTLRITAYFEPRGLWGRAYWAALVPVHRILLGGLARAIAKRARLNHRR